MPGGLWHEAYGCFITSIFRRFLGGERPTLPGEMLNQGDGGKAVNRSQISFAAPERSTIQDSRAAALRRTSLTIKVVHPSRLA